MQFTLQYHDGIFEISTSGDATLQGFNDFVNAIFGHEDWKPGGRILIDHSQFNSAPFTIDDIKGISYVAKQYSEQFGKAKMATIVSRDLEYGMTRMWEVFVEVDVWNVSHKLFRDRDKAIEWLYTV